MCVLGLVAVCSSSMLLLATQNKFKDSCENVRLEGPYLKKNVYYKIQR